MLVESFDEHCNSSLYNLKYHLLGHILEDVNIFGELSVLEIIHYQLFNARNEQMHRRSSKRRRIITMETLNVMRGNYKRILRN